MGLMLEQLVRTQAFTNFLSQICGTGTDCLHRGKNTSDTFDFGNYSAFIWMNMELLTPTAASQHSCRSMWPVSASGCGTQWCIISFYKPIIRLSETPRPIGWTICCFVTVRCCSDDLNCFRSRCTFLLFLLSDFRQLTLGLFVGVDYSNQHAAMPLSGSFRTIFEQLGGFFWMHLATLRWE